MRLAVLTFAWLGTFVWLGSACVADVLDEHAGEPRLRDAHCIYDEPPVRCAYLDVPVLHVDPSAGTIALFVTIVPARVPDDREPVVVLSGGPGGITGSLGWLEHPAREHHDIVLLDQRGAGLSEPSLYCGELETSRVANAGASHDDPARLKAFRDAAAACRARYVGRGVDLTAFNTEESAADIDDLRRALGAARLNLHGGSYGTRLALEVMRAFPNGVRSAALFGTYPHPRDILSDSAQDGDAALRAVLAACAEDPDCPEADPQAVFERRMRELDERPMTRTLDDGSSYALTSIDVGVRLFSMMYQTSEIPNVPGVAVAGFAPGPGEDPPVPGLGVFDSAMGLYLSVTCREDYPFADRERADRAPFYMRGFRWDASVTVAQCEGWDVPPGPARFKEPVRSDVPTLLVVGRFDPITPPRASYLAAETLSRSQVVELPGAGHDTQQDTPCVQGMLEAFIADPAAPLDTSCVDAELGPPDF